MSGPVEVTGELHAEWFTRPELACRCCNTLVLDPELLEKLDKLRNLVDVPLHIASGYRCQKHNKAVKGASGSYHMRGQAVDILLPRVPMLQFLSAAFAVGFHGFGAYSNFIHLDIGPDRYWTAPNAIGYD